MRASAIGFKTPTNIPVSVVAFPFLLRILCEYLITPPHLSNFIHGSRIGRRPLKEPAVSSQHLRQLVPSQLTTAAIGHTRYTTESSQGVANIFYCSPSTRKTLDEARSSLISRYGVEGVGGIIIIFMTKSVVNENVSHIPRTRSDINRTVVRVRLLRKPSAT